LLFISLINKMLDKLKKPKINCSYEGVKLVHQELIIWSSSLIINVLQANLFRTLHQRLLELVSQE